jgi:glycosyltransferase involved in cell wall biosynthesis
MMEFSWFLTKTAMPAISIIIPSYNHADFLKQRLDSVFAQTFDDFEVIILDDCSTDHSRDIIEQYRSHPRVKHIVYNECNSGSTFIQWEKGIELCGSGLIWIAESDDFTDPDFIFSLLPAMLSNEQLGIAYCQSLSVDRHSEIIGNWSSYTEDLSDTQFNSDFYMDGKDYIRNFLVHKNAIPNASAVVFRKKYYEQAGGAETGIKYCGDWITWLKILTISDIYYQARPLNYFRQHENSVIAQAVKHFDHTRYIEQYDRAMRKRFQSYLEQKGGFDAAILDANHHYIMREDDQEQQFNLTMTTDNNL